MEIVYIGLGSNLQDPVSQVSRALSSLSRLASSQWRTASSLYRSAPIGPQDQPDYINAVAEIATSLSPELLLEQLQAIEQQHGRQRDGKRWTARTLDLDILLYGQKIINLNSLIIPHPGLYERAFVLYPLQEIAPGLEIPDRGSLKKIILDSGLQSPEKISLD